MRPLGSYKSATTPIALAAASSLEQSCDVVSQGNLQGDKGEVRRAAVLREGAPVHTVHVGGGIAHAHT